MDFIDLVDDVRTTTLPNATEDKLVLAGPIDWLVKKIERGWETGKGDDRISYWFVTRLFVKFQHPRYVVLLLAMFLLESATLFLTDTSCFGYCFADLEVGDMVVLVAGAHRPLILRKTEGNEYRVVGSACVTGIMNGEAWPEDVNVAELQEFVLV